MPAGFTHDRDWLALMIEHESEIRRLWCPACKGWPPHVEHWWREWPRPVGILKLCGRCGAELVGRGEGEE